MDDITRAELGRGERLVEVLKQGQYEPMSLAHQVLAVFVGIEGFLDDVPVDAVGRFETEWLDFVNGRYPEIIRDVETTKDFSDELQERAKAAATEFKGQFASKDSEE